MRSLVLIASISWCATALGCGSSDSGGGASGASSSAGAGGSTTSNAGSSAGGSSAGSSNGGNSNGGSSNGGSSNGGSSNGGSSNGGSSNGGTSGASNASSPACQKYCECHVMNCSATPIPGGLSCADFCAGMTADQLTCRQNMCSLVPAQPDNDHCTHSVGLVQCL